MQRICITADDYGMHPAINEAIETLADAGDISAAAVMVHEGAMLDTIARLRATGVALGLHLVFTQEQPVLAGLVDTALAPAGNLPASPYALVRTLVRRPYLRHSLFAELEAQLDRYVSLGLPLDFINSHEHVHEIPVLWNMVAELVDRTSAPAVRAARAQPITATHQGALALLSKTSWRMRKPRTPPQILSPLGAGQAGQMRRADVVAMVDRGLRWHGANGAIPELVVHPAADDAPLLARYGPAIGERRAEFDLLRSPQLRDAWRRRDISLVRPGRVAHHTTTSATVARITNGTV